MITSTMPLLTIHHKTEYRYAHPVAFGEHRVMLRPRDGHDLRVRSSMHWSLSKARPALRKFHCVERTCLCGQKCNATFRRARFDRAATWLGGMVVGEGAPARRRLVSL